MAKIRPFQGLRPIKDMAEKVATLPYDVFSKEELAQFRNNPYHFFHVTRSEIDLPENTDLQSDIVYETASKNLQKMIDDKVFILDNQPYYYIYEMEMNGRIQTGIVCGSSIEDYNNEIIKKHEYTRPDKVLDRVKHIQITKAQTGIIFLAYKDVHIISSLLNEWKNTHETEYNFTAEDGIRHTVWVINDNSVIAELTELFDQKVPTTYIADGHHRSAALSTIAETDHNINNNFILSCIFPESHLSIFDYNRIVKTLNGHSKESFLEKLSEKFHVKKIDKQNSKPKEEKTFGMYLEGQWYQLKTKPGTYDLDPIGILDVSILQNNIMSEILGIHDSRIDHRIDFVGGIRGLKELELIVDAEAAVAAFACYPVSIHQLFQVADSGSVMPPKSTWFEPKTRDGLIVFQLDKS